MGLEQIWLLGKLRKKFKMKPTTTSIEIVFIFIIFIIVCYFGAGYLPEKGRQLASVSKTTKLLETQEHSKKIHQNAVGVPSTTTKRDSTIFTVVVIICIVILFLSLAVLYIRWKKSVSAIKQNQPIIVQLSSEINESIWHLRRFWRDYHRAKNGFNRPEDFSEIAWAQIKHSEVLPIEMRLSLPNWYQITIEQHSPFDLLPKKAARQVEQLYQRLNDIEKLYAQIKETIKKEKHENQPLDDIKQFEDFIRKLLEHGNPLKATHRDRDTHR